MEVKTIHAPQQINAYIHLIPIGIDLDPAALVYASMGMEYGIPRAFSYHVLDPTPIDLAAATEASRYLCLRPEIPAGKCKFVFVTLVYDEELDRYGLRVQCMSSMEYAYFPRKVHRVEAKLFDRYWDALPIEKRPSEWKPSTLTRQYGRDRNPFEGRPFRLRPARPVDPRTKFYRFKWPDWLDEQLLVINRRHQQAYLAESEAYIARQEIKKRKRDELARDAPSGRTRSKRQKA